MIAEVTISSVVAVLLAAAAVVSYIGWRLDRTDPAKHWLKFVDQSDNAPRYLRNLPVVTVPAAIAMVTLAVGPRDPTGLLVGTCVVAACLLGAVWFGLRPPSVLLPPSRRATHGSAAILPFDRILSAILVLISVLLALIASLVALRAAA